MRINADRGARKGLAKSGKGKPVKNFGGRRGLAKIGRTKRSK
jgi:hypothetical protein